MAFWSAYVLTRPLGASADWLGKPASIGRGLGWGDGPVVTVTTVAIAALVAYVTVTGSGRSSTVVGPAVGRGVGPGQRR